MSVIKKSGQLGRDKEAIRNLKAVLSMRDRLTENTPGKLVNGRKLLQPVNVAAKR